MHTFRYYSIRMYYVLLPFYIAWSDKEYYDQDSYGANILMIGSSVKCNMIRQTDGLIYRLTNLLTNRVLLLLLLCIYKIMSIGRNSDIIDKKPTTD